MEEVIEKPSNVSGEKDRGVEPVRGVSPWEKGDLQRILRGVE